MSISILRRTSALIAILYIITLSACTEIEENVPVPTDAEPAMASVTENETITSADNYTETTADTSETKIELVVTAAATETAPTETTAVTEQTATYAENPPTSLGLSLNEITLTVGQSQMPYVTMYPTDSDNKGEIWTSSDETVATVDDKGLITAVGAGRCTVTVTAAANLDVYGTVEVLVDAPPETDSSGALLPASIELSITSITLEAGQSQMPIVTMYPENCGDKSEIWTSSDESVATVDDSGLITAVSSGICTVTVAAAANPSVEAYVTVNVEGVDAPTYIDGILVVNKTYALPKSYGSGVGPDAQAAFEEMAAAAKEDGISLWTASGYRSYDYQQGLYDKYVKEYGQTEADRFSARAGHSEHQTGLAFDLNIIDDSFAGTPEAEWIEEHCYEYGFILRYPEGKEDITGYQYEPWHVRYLGKETAKKVYESGLTLEEYLGITSEYAE